MKQILQSLSSGDIAVEDIPAPQVTKGTLLIETHKTLISAGTERMLLDFGKAGMIGKVKQQPDKVKEVLEKVKTDGVLTTMEAVKSKLDQPIPLGYCNVGRVLQVGEGVDGFQVGDRVLSNGAHAEVVRVPQNLCVKVPEAVADEQAAFTVLGAIGLQGIRLVQPTLGECVVVQGLGIIGLMTVQLLIAHGCRVLGADYDTQKCELAKSFGADVVDLSAGEDLQDRADAFSRGRGVDAVLITASSKSDDIVHQAATTSRKRGRIVLVGVVGLNLRRDDFYEKELSFQVSCSYGAGRYDPNYEDKGQDYPVGYVRWTEGRNFEAVLDMLATGKLDVKPLISQHFKIEQAQQAYQALGDTQNLGLILDYDVDQTNAKQDRLVALNNEASYEPTASSTEPVIAFIGAGNYASRMLMPTFKKLGGQLDTVVSSQGISGVIHGKKQNFQRAGTDFKSVINDKKINTIVIATRHNMHAGQTLDALKAGKHVFVEKPLCINQAQLNEIKGFFESVEYKNLQQKPHLMVGFNRRFAPFTQMIKQELDKSSNPKCFIYTVNAGKLPDDHWHYDLDVGGGRLISEGCHFIDLISFLTSATLVNKQIIGVADQFKDKISINLEYSDGSIGTVHYLANGSKAFPKERLDVFADGKVFQNDNYKKLKIYGKSSLKGKRLLKPDKGQSNCVQAFINSIKQGGAPPIHLRELIEVSQACIELSNRLGNGTKDDL